jgi:hypothetical protein
MRFHHLLHVGQSIPDHARVEPDRDELAPALHPFDRIDRDAEYFGHLPSTLQQDAFRWRFARKILSLHLSLVSFVETPDWTMRELGLALSALTDEPDSQRLMSSPLNPAVNHDAGGSSIPASSKRKN